ncbi:type II toxin-antitoxin system HicA family toxin [Paramicrobacterium agarici]|uniref:Putative RNA binding protein YcfA (HicA-like mRNA interferase family) n=1 Tax=Paramicrobacterium agarici TaxID=630514 RepID=A0A2A9DW83_9MICO|nr:putative RNA binding protein YcfA (HicA-like mRNA interferase family) [Microbacterium agarici]TQO23644.1 putative RNA binding protein YcfA (HicA-like mRNA interferase family) [Microbacterium agarici]
MVRAVKYREVRKFLEESGWVQIRTTGSHTHWQGPDGNGRLSVPRHRTVSPGVIRQIITVIPEYPKSWR